MCKGVKDLIVMMNKELDNIQLYKNENTNENTSENTSENENKKNNKNKNIINKREEIYNCIKYVQNYLDKTIESKNTLELENI